MSRKRKNLARERRRRRPAELQRLAEQVAREDRLKRMRDHVVEDECEPCSHGIGCEAYHRGEIVPLDN